MEKALIDKIETIKKEYDEIMEKLQDPEVLSDIKQTTSLTKKEKKLFPKVDLYNKYIENKRDEEEATELLSIETDSEMSAMLKETITEAKKQLEILEAELLEEMAEKDPADEKDCIFEIQGAAGGDEAKIFAGDLYRMYQRYFSKEGFEIEVIDEEPSDNGGYSFVSFKVTGKDPYGTFKYESGVHRVQRVPQTETQGRVHTSTATVAVLPEAEDIDLEINSADLRIDTYRSGGKGGQHANKTDSAVRITHIPTGVVAQSQDGRSQHANKDNAMNILKARLYEAILIEANKNSSENKNSLVGSGDRSEKIRTYNYPQNRITDHRISLTLKKLDRVMDGALGEIIDVLVAVGRGKGIDEG